MDGDSSKRLAYVPDREIERIKLTKLTSKGG